MYHHINFLYILWLGLCMSRGNYEWAKTPAGVHPVFQIFSTAGRRAPSGAVAIVCIVPRKLEQRRIPAKNAATRHLNAMGIAPKVVGASFLQPLTLMFRTNAPHTASQIPWVMQYAEQFTLIQELTPGASISASERAAGG